jgi:outer membrane protein assembly factor BamD (BamD/ComL family)
MQTKQKIIITVASIIAVAIVATGTVFILQNTAGKNVKKETDVITKQTADDLKAQAIRALKDDNTAAAKKLFEQAKAQYTELNDNTNKIDMEAQIYLIDHPRK